uniref:Uncharacterized protein n=1 Tax=Steinernema glaseri TaxID=37863 RepID=A0A1I7YQ97_9BILA
MVKVSNGKFRNPFVVDDRPVFLPRRRPHETVHTAPITQVDISNDALGVTSTNTQLDFGSLLGELASETLNITSYLDLGMERIRGYMLWPLDQCGSEFEEVFESPSHAWNCAEEEPHLLQLKPLGRRKKQRKEVRRKVRRRSRRLEPLSSSFTEPTPRGSLWPVRPMAVVGEDDEEASEPTPRGSLWPVIPMAVVGEDDEEVSVNFVAFGISYLCEN